MPAALLSGVPFHPRPHPPRMTWRQGEDGGRSPPSRKPSGSVFHEHLANGADLSSRMRLTPSAESLPCLVVGKPQAYRPEGGVTL